MATEKNSNDNAQDLSGPNSPHFQIKQILHGESAKGSGNEAEFAAWEQVAEGRFMPRRVRGSCAGRALG